MVLGVLERPRLADDVQHGEVVLTTGRDAVDDDVGYRHVRGDERGLGLRLLGFDRLDLGGKLFGLFQQGGTLVG